jgi:6-phosphogluconolactonase (cycloisomerase 2 family)
MRMKFNKPSQLLLVSAASLLLAGLVTACGTNTVDFVFVTSGKAVGSNNYGEIDVFEVNSESGSMRQIPTSPFFSGGRNPVAEAVSTDNTNLYVVNQDDNSIVQFTIGNDGKIYPQTTVNTPGTYPMAVAVTSTHLYVLDAYQPLPSCSTAAPCSGSIGVFALGASDALGSTPVSNGALTYWPLWPSNTSDVLEPTAINISSTGAYLYVTAYDLTSSVNYLFGFSINSSGALTALNSGAPLLGGVSGACSPTYFNAPFRVGTCPAAMASSFTSSGDYLYVTDSKNGSVHGFSVAPGTGIPSELSGSPYATGDHPSAIVVDPTYPYAYVSNSFDGTVTAYSISNGALTSIGAYSAGLQPIAIGIDPSTNHFLYTVNFLGSNVSAFELSPTAGTLINTVNSPFASAANPTAVAAIPHGTSK